MNDFVEAHIPKNTIKNEYENRSGYLQAQGKF